MRRATMVLSSLQISRGSSRVEQREIPADPQTKPTDLVWSPIIYAHHCHLISLSRNTDTLILSSYRG